MATSDLKLLLTLEDKASTGLKKFIDEPLKALGVGMAAAAAGIAAFGIASIKSFTETGDQLAKLSDKTGIGVETLSELKYAADLSGGSIEGLQTSFRGMANFIDLVNQKSATSVDALKQIGLKAEDLAGLSPEETFYKLAGAVADIKDPLLRAAEAQNIFGKSGTDLLPMLKDGAAGLEKMRQEAHDLGVTMTDEDARAVEKFQDSITRIQKAFQGLGFSIAEQVVPALQPLTDALTDLVKALPIKEISELLTKLLPPLVEAFTKFAAALPVDALVKFISDALSPLLEVLPSILDALTPILDLFGQILEAIPIKEIAELTAQFLKLAIEVLAPLMIPMLQTVTNILTDLKPVLDVVFTVLEDIMSIIGPILTGISKIIGGVFGTTETTKTSTGTTTKTTIGTTTPTTPVVAPVVASGGEVYDTVADWAKALHIKGYASGGIVTSPTLALVGESGPEAVVPLSKMGGDIHLHIGNYLGDETSKRSLMRDLKTLIAQDNRRTAFNPLSKGYFAGSSSL